MNAIMDSMKEIRASEELKAGTLQYLSGQRKVHSIPVTRHVLRYALIAVCLLMALGMGGYSVYRKPVSYISIDINPSIELGINRFERVVSADAYNEDGQNILKGVTLKHVPYGKAIDRLLSDETYSGYLTADSVLVFTVVSDRPDTVIKEINESGTGHAYNAQIYTSDEFCMEEAHQYDMSFGKYRAYQELSLYDENVTVEDCHGMTIGEIQDRIEGCKHHRWSEDNVQQIPENNWGGHHGGRRGHHGRYR